MIDFGVSSGEPIRGILSYKNVSASIGACVSSKLATLHELATVYGTRDLWDMLEINAVNSHNKNLANKDA